MKIIFFLKCDVRNILWVTNIYTHGIAIKKSQESWRAGCPRAESDGNLVYLLIQIRKVALVLHIPGHWGRSIADSLGYRMSLKPALCVCVCVSVCLSVCLCYVCIYSICVYLHWDTVLLCTRLAFNSQRSTCLCLPSARIKGVRHHTQKILFYRVRDVAQW